MNEQVRRRPETRWIRLRIAISSGIVKREGKEHNAVVTMVLTTEVGAAVPAAIAAEDSAEAVVASGVVVVDAKGICGGILEVRRSAREAPRVVREK